MTSLGPIRDQRGVTAVELLIAVMLLGIALIGLAASFPYALIGVAAGGFQTTATLLAQERLDEAKNMGWNQLCTMVGTEDPVSVDVGGTSTDFPGFTRETAVETVPGESAISCSGAAPTGDTVAVVRVTVSFDPIYQTTVSTVMAAQ
jgi:Tfp pilus assembly protein PilV